MTVARPGFAYLMTRLLARLTAVDGANSRSDGKIKRMACRAPPAAVWSMGSPGFERMRVAMSMTFPLSSWLLNSHCNIPSNRTKAEPGVVISKSNVRISGMGLVLWSKVPQRPAFNSQGRCANISAVAAVEPNRDAQRMDISQDVRRMGPPKVYSIRRSRRAVRLFSMCANCRTDSRG